MFQQHKIRKFEPDYRIAVLFETSEFDNVLHRNKAGKITPMMPPLGKNCKSDIVKIKNKIKKYGYCTKENLFKLTGKPQYSDVTKAKKKITERLRLKPDKKHSIIVVTAGHGMIFNGSQALLLNQFEKSTQFYKMWAVEISVRDIARAFPNSHIIAIFACCREIFNPVKHKGGFSGTIAEAKAHFDKLDSDSKLARERQVRA